MGRFSMRVVSVLLVALIAVVAVQADELKDLSSADVAPALKTESDVVQKTAEKANLGEGTGNAFSGALLTSGSFTMMASNSVEEEELGEGEGNAFSGALLTSGSFTMM